jgi:molybdenum cofactor biosynthesis enzyme MoaA
MALSAAYNIVEGRVRTHSLEVHIVDHCNLRCAACCSLSPFLPKWLIDPADFARDLHLARKALAPTWFKLVGGEPLLHPAIDECLAIARRAELAEIISVTTNAFLLPRMSARFWQLVDALTISLYPDPALPPDIVALIEARASENDVTVNWKQQDNFVQMDVTICGQTTRRTARSMRSAGCVVAAISSAVGAFMPAPGRRTFKRCLARRSI